MKLAQTRGLAPQIVVAGDVLFDQLVDRGQFLPQEGLLALQTRAQRRPGQTEPVARGDQDVAQLPAMFKQFTQDQRHRIGRHCQARLHVLTVAAQQARVDPVGFGQQAFGVGEGAHPAGLHDADFEPRRQQVRDHGPLVAAAGLAHHAHPWLAAQLRYQPGMSGGSVGNLRDAGAVERVIESVLGHVQTDIGDCRFGRLHLVMRAQGSFSGSSFDQAQDRGPLLLFEVEPLVTNRPAGLVVSTAASRSDVLVGAQRPFRGSVATPPQAPSSDELYGPFSEAACGAALVRCHRVKHTR